MCGPEPHAPKSPAEIAAPRDFDNLARDADFVCELLEAINHHIRSPLTVIMGHVELWKDSTDEFPASLDDSLAAVRRAGQRLNVVSAAVCDLIEVASIDPHIVSMAQVGRLIGDEVASFRKDAAGRGTELLLTTERAGRCRIDQTHLKRALGELVDNAVKYAPDRSTVHIDASVSVSGLRVAVSDDGHGIAPADRDRLMRPFERGADVGSHVPGTGMGLTMAAAVAYAHGGRLILTDQAGEGFLACLDIPSGFTQVDT